MKNKFSPIFIVGNPRSGTTLLASIFNRHTKISVPPETQFFFDVYKQELEGQSLGRQRLVELALSSKRIRDMDLDKSVLENAYLEYEPTFQTLLQCIISLYAENQNKIRPGEKTPLHLHYVAKILDWYPYAKIICVIRDGRDVVNSLLNVSWHHNNIISHSYEWLKNALLSIKYQSKFRDSFIVIKYENLVNNPQRIVRDLCQYIGVPYEDEMLREEINSSVVPEWEKEWKSLALSSPDPSRIGGWRLRSQREKCILNLIMKNGLILWDYKCTEKYKIIYVIEAILRSLPYHPKLKPIFAWIKWKLFGSFIRIK